MSLIIVSKADVSKYKQARHRNEIITQEGIKTKQKVDNCFFRQERIPAHNFLNCI